MSEVVGALFSIDLLMIKKWTKRDRLLGKLDRFVLAEEIKDEVT